MMCKLNTQIEYTPAVLSDNSIKIKAVVFDFGGVLSVQPPPMAYKELSKLSGFAIQKIKKYNSSYEIKFEKGKITSEAFFSRLSKFLKIPEKKVKKIWSLREEKSFKNKALYRLAKQIQESGFKIAILSNTNPGHEEIHRRKNNYYPFRTVLLSCRIGSQKPEPQAYRILLKKLKVKPHECVFIDDVKKHVLGAKKIGMYGIHYKNPIKLKKDLKKLGVL